MTFIQKLAVNLFAIASLVTSSLVHANTSEYEIIFDGSIVGNAGVGSFLWDDSTNLISDITWDFGNLIGGIDDTIINWSNIVFGDTISSIALENLTQQDVSSVNCITVNCAISTNGYVSYGSSSATNIIFSTDGLGAQTYAIYDSIAGAFAVQGNFSTSEVTVPESSSIFLLVNRFFIFWAQ